MTFKKYTPKKSSTPQKKYSVPIIHLRVCYCGHNSFYHRNFNDSTVYCRKCGCTEFDAHDRLAKIETLV